MATYAVVKTGGKQYIVKPNDEIVVDKVEGSVGDKIEVPALATFTEDGTVTLEDVSSNYVCLGLWGPKARKILEKVTMELFSSEYKL